jgi:hypothetical protein
VCGFRITTYEIPASELTIEKADEDDTGSKGKEESSDAA